MNAPTGPTFAPLDRVDLFHNLKPDQQIRVMKMARTSRFADGAQIYFEGDPAERLYLLSSGRARLTQVTPEGQQIILHHVSPGEAFGIIAVLTGAAYPVSAQSIGESEAHSWDKTTIKTLMIEYPVIALNAIEILAGRVRDFQERIRELTTQRVERRIARTLLRLAGQTGRKVDEGVLIDLPLTRQHLAEMTGTTVFTVSRTLSQWESQGLIKTGREKVVICYPHGLVSIAEDFAGK